MKVYFISGLGADKTVFRNIQLPDGSEPIFLDWIVPLEKESLVSYAHRLSESIDASQPFGLIGLSFGGMLAVEIAKIKKPEKLVLISSITCVQHLPRLYRIASVLKLHQLVPVSFFRQASIIKRFFTSESSQDKKLLKQMIRKTDPSFIKWAMNAVVNWNNTQLPQGIIHIHGSGDRILPMSCTKPTHIIPKGGHLMVVDRAEEINQILRKFLN